ncbi:MAG: tyrosine-type recombinase/integrase [Actinobacteria bacterium]|nr:tyrosine-type recombinase/integrase [Actinomycetota bacterium]
MSVADPAQALQISTDNPMAAFLAFLAEEQVTVRTARAYLGHLQRFAGWLRRQYQAELLEATSHDLREYRTHLAARQRPASVNAALAALHRFYAWAVSSRRMQVDPTTKLKLLATQPLAPQGFSSVERQWLRREAERAGPMTDAIVITLLNTGLRVAELVRLTWEEVTLRDRSGQAAIRGKGEKARAVPLNAGVREALRAIQPTPPEGPIFRGKRGPYTDRGVRNLLAELGRRAGVEQVYPHRFRHDTAHRLVEQMDPPTTAALLGHSRLDTIRIYSQPDQDALQRVADLLEQS